MVRPLTIWPWRQRTVSPARPLRAPDTATDLDLLQAGRTGDKAALAILFARHETAIYRLCLGFAGSTADAEDRVQEVILKALAAIERPGGFREDSTFKTWLFRIAVRTCLEHRRNVRNTAPLSLSLPDQSRGPEQVSVDRATLREAFASLSPNQRLLLILREQEQYSIGEIAIVLGWSEKKVNNELYKARLAIAAWREGAGL